MQVLVLDQFSLASFAEIDYSDSIGDGLRSRGGPYLRYEFREPYPGNSQRGNLPPVGWGTKT